MKKVDDVAFQKIKSTREGNNNKSSFFEMDILDEGALDKALTVPEKLYTKNPWKKIYQVIGNEYFKQSDVEF